MIRLRVYLTVKIDKLETRIRNLLLEKIASMNAGFGHYRVPEEEIKKLFNRVNHEFSENQTEYTTFADRFPYVDSYIKYEALISRLKES